MEEDLRAAYLLEDMSSITFRGTELTTFLACGSQIAAETVARFEESAPFCDRISEVLDIYRSIAMSSEWRATAPVFVDELARGARTEWFPTLSLLRARSYRLGELSHAFSKLVNAWVLFGKAIGLDEKQEWARADKRCSYYLCPFSKQDPPGALSTCKGCGQVRYCGKECQRSDWKNHKQKCGNRLKEGATNTT